MFSIDNSNQEIYEGNIEIMSKKALNLYNRWPEMKSTQSSFFCAEAFTIITCIKKPTSIGFRVTLTTLSAAILLALRLKTSIGFEIANITQTGGGIVMNLPISWLENAQKNPKNLNARTELPRCNIFHQTGCARVFL